MKRTNQATVTPLKPAPTVVFTKRERAKILDDLQFIFDNAHKSLDTDHSKSIASMVRIWSGNLRNELEVLKDVATRKEVLSFPGLVLDVSILTKMNTRKNANARGYLIWPNPANIKAEGTPPVEATYSDHTRRGSGTGGGGIYCGLRADFLKRSKDARLSDIYIDVVYDNDREVFLCPFPKWGKANWEINTCRNRTARLFLPRNSRNFGCAECHGIQDDAPKFWRKIEYVSSGYSTRKYWQANQRKRQKTYQKETMNARAR